MKIAFAVQFVFMLTVLRVEQTIQTSFYNYDDDYFDLEPGMKAANNLNGVPGSHKLLFNGLIPSEIMAFTEPPLPTAATTECVTYPPSTNHADQEKVETINGQQQASPATTNKPEDIVLNKEEEREDDKAKELKMLVQLLYIAQARVQLEAVEIKKAQAMANSAQQSLEEAANHVRKMAADLRNSQQEVASAAIRAQTAQLKLAAHDQLLFAARQDVDALSTQLVGLQAAAGITQPKASIDLSQLLDKLKQPLQDSEKPTPVPSLIQITTTKPTNHQQTHKFHNFNAPHYRPFFNK